MEDDIDLGETLEDILKKAGYEVIWVKNGIDASTITYEQNFDLYIFDINVPELNGLKLLEFLRNANDKTPTIFISALVDLETITKAFNVGAGSYLKKPFFPKELLLQIKAKFQQSHTDIFYKNLVYNPQNKELKKDGKLLLLSKKQQQLIEVFLINLNTTLEPYMLMEHCAIKSISSLRVAINKLKKYTGIEIRSLHGIGYRIETR
jgi:DNA-binding response OmpR family regulator